MNAAQEAPVSPQLNVELCSETICFFDAEKANRTGQTLGIDGGLELRWLDFLLIQPDANAAHCLAQQVSTGYANNSYAGIVLGHGVLPKCRRSRGNAPFTPLFRYRTLLLRSAGWKGRRLRVRARAIVRWRCSPSGKG